MAYEARINPLKYAIGVTIFFVALFFIGWKVLLHANSSANPTPQEAEKERLAAEEKFNPVAAEYKALFEKIKKMKPESETNSPLTGKTAVVDVQGYLHPEHYDLKPDFKAQTPEEVQTLVYFSIHLNEEKETDVARAYVYDRESKKLKHIIRVERATYLGGPTMHAAIKALHLLLPKKFYP